MSRSGETGRPDGGGRSSPHAADGITGNARILVVEDHPDQAESLCRLLSVLGYRPMDAVSSGEAALEAVDAVAPDLVLMDLHLAGDMDGITAADRIRAQADVPVVFLTAFADPPLLERAAAVAPYGYLVKPVAAEALHAALSVALHRARSDREARRVASLDPLTGAFNRRHLETLLPAEITRAERHGRPLSLALFDIDHFKSINDLRGHPAGDRVLIRVVETALGRLRRSDMLVRWGGEEFVVLLPETDLESAVRLAETLRVALEQAGTAGGDRVTASFGVTRHRPGESGQLWLERADALMYEAKRRGRNRVVVQED
jgi:diguanylate cyclase (GGDEF)-like protein